MITKKTKMYFETDDYSELTSFYNGEASKQSDSADDYGEDSHEEQIALLTRQCIHDKKVFAWRQMHRKKYDKYIAKLEAKQEKIDAKLEAKREKKNPPPKTELEAETKPESVKCTSMVVSHSDLITSPAEYDPDADEYEGG